MNAVVPKRLGPLQCSSVSRSRNTGLITSLILFLLLLSSSFTTTMSWAFQVAPRSAGRAITGRRSQALVGNSALRFASTSTSTSTSRRTIRGDWDATSSLHHRSWRYQRSQLFSSGGTILEGETSLPTLENEAPEEYDVQGDDDDATFDQDDMSSLPQGIPNGFFVVQQYALAEDSPIDWTSIDLDQGDVDRLDLTPQNVSLPIALMLLDPVTYPSISRARKSCRKGSILIHRGPLSIDEKTGLATAFDAAKCIRGRVGDRVFPGDAIGMQVRMGGGQYLGVNNKKPPFDLPVVYEDDHFALVNKPAGVVVYSHRKGGHGIMTVRAALPFALAPPKAGTYSIIRRPMSVHRLDKPTSGILCVAKTKPAMLDLSRQFRERVIKKTYTAIVMGIPAEDSENAISSEAAYDMGVDVDPQKDELWQHIDFTLEEKSAVTMWKALHYAKSLHAKNGYLTMVELKPKTGRYHQLRRHMAWVCECPIVGDGEYDGGTADTMRFRERGLFLCSNRIVLEHPFYNSKEGRSVWEALDEEAKYTNNIWLSKANRVMVSASIALPEKFENLLTREEERFIKFEGDEPSQ